MVQILQKVRLASVSGSRLTKLRAHEPLILNCRNRCTEVLNNSLSGPVALAYSSFEDTKVECRLPPLVINHGLFGSKGNWKSLSKCFTQKTGTKVFCVDARNHGDSPHSQEMSVRDMAADLVRFTKDNSLPRCIYLGHSLGGRAVMTLALTQPQLVDKLIVVDISPNVLPNTINGEAKIALLAMQESLTYLTPDMNIAQARRAADAFMERTIKGYNLRQFLLTNLRRGRDHFEYQINISAIQENLDKLLRMPPLKGVFEGDVLFVRGGQSGYIKRNDFPLIKQIFPKAQIETIDNAAHWVHADKPTEFLDLVSDFILKK
ncbi:protein ABHD11-like isoform X2 [Varroa jacobsoni]|uniref:sn-1-specific diacylglycerol lipase ABHD11 n=1 Tax=Varroa destructor TaxID=109461 RepID=A0A7M7MIG7_VARDE|nr:protein ABHD11-like isoform X2 [Varroa destructor]XP_022698160.1 protein ABHD11-like isoform X2 [Varroa jacobsoni]